MKVIINKETKRVEFESAFKARFSNSVSFSPVLKQDIVSALEPEAVLVEIGEKPSFHPIYQDCYLRDPFERDGEITTAWAVVNKDTSDINTIFNDAFEKFIDDKAKSFLYANQDRMISYIGDADPQTDREARFMKAWRSECWIIAKKELEDIFAEIKANPHLPIPGPEMVYSKFPEFVIPANY